MTEIVEFIKAQLDIDEQLALATTPVPVPGRWKAARDKHAADDAHLALIQGDEVDDPGYEGYSYNHRVIVSGAEWQDEAEANLRHIARHDPARVLADMEAKRAIVAECDEVLNATREDGSFVHHPRARYLARHTLRRLATVHAGQPGFKPEWRLS